MINFLSLLFVAFALVLASLFGTTVVVGPALDIAGTCCCTGPVCSCPDCSQSYPTQIHVTLTYITGNCSCVVGTYPILCASGSSWAGVPSICGQSISVGFNCTGAGITFTSSFSSACLGISTWTTVSTSCSPLDCIFTLAWPSTCCNGAAGGTVQAEVTL